MHGLHLLLTIVARDLGTDVAGGSRRRRQTQNWVHRRRQKVRDARHSCSTPLELLPSTACGVEQHSWRQPLLRQYGSTGTVCDGVGAHQASPVTAAEIGLGQDQNPSLQTRRCIRLSGGALAPPICSVSLETSKWPISSVIATPRNLTWTPGRPSYSNPG